MENTVRTFDYDLTKKSKPSLFFQLLLGVHGAPIQVVPKLARVELTQPRKSDTDLATIQILNMVEILVPIAAILKQPTVTVFLTVQSSLHLI